MAKFDFLVLGAGRSGTSLFAAMLNEHPDLACEMEYLSVNLLGNPVNSIWKKDTAAQRLKLFISACNKKADQSTAKKWGNKITTEQLDFLKACNQNLNLEKEISEAFKAQKILFIFRDGRTCIPSKIKRGGKSLHEAIASWKRSVLLGDLLAKMQPKSFLSIRYENLLQQPKEELIRVCDALEVPFNDKMLEGVMSSQLPKMYQFGVLKKDNVQLPEVADWHKEIETDLKRLGYL